MLKESLGFSQDLRQNFKINLNYINLIFQRLRKIHLFFQYILSWLQILVRKFFYICAHIYWRLMFWMNPRILYLFEAVISTHLKSMFPMNTP